MSTRNETGEQNAERFVQAVMAAALDQRVIIFWEDGRPAWPWMKNKAWRDYVFRRLGELRIPVRDGEFKGPDALDESWMFVAHSTANQHRIQTMELTDKIDDGLSLAKSVETIKQNRAICWWCFVILGVVVALALSTCMEKPKPLPTQELVP